MLTNTFSACFNVFRFGFEDKLRNFAIVKIAFSLKDPQSLMASYSANIADRETEIDEKFPYIVLS